MSRKKGALDSRTWPAFKHRSVGPKKGTGTYEQPGRERRGVKGKHWKSAERVQKAFAKLGDVLNEFIKENKD